MIQGIKSKDVEKWWHHVDAYINKALERQSLGEFTSNDIKMLCQSQDMQLWVNWDNGVNAVGITQILNYPQSNTLLMFLLGGDNMDMWKQEGWDLLNAFGKANNCKHIQIYGRKGWGNYLKDYGVKEQGRIFYKEIA